VQELLAKVRAITIAIATLRPNLDLFIIG